MILIVPAGEKGRGGGHLSRCITLVKKLRELGREAVLYLPQKIDTSFIEKLFKTMDFNSGWLEYKNLSDPFELIILDRFQTTLDEILFWKNLAPVIGIDEGGSSRDKFDFLIDILIPYNFIKPAANITSASLLFNSDINNISKSAGLRDLQYKKILITFGHEDTAGLGLKTAGILSKINKHRRYEITLLKGSLSADNMIEKQHAQLKQNDIKITEVIPNLASHLNEYDLVITHYGITAYEAFYAGIPVLLDHPTPYHKKLAKAAGFKSFNKKYLTTENTELHIERKDTRQKLINSSSRRNLAELISSFSPIVSKCCPVCAAEKNKSAARFNDRTYRRCGNCGIIFMDRIIEHPIEYDKDYFFDSYVKQYGKTYLDDFENIKNTGKKRLKLIAKYLNKGKSNLRFDVRRKQRDNKDFNLLSLLDIGCAYGPFLAAAKEEGFSPFGLDPAKDAVSYVNEKLGIQAIHGFFPIHHFALNIPHSFNVITMWYVIEHFRSCISVFEEVKKLLKPGGIFAFSTPSFTGISGRSSLSRFIKASPADHFTIWSPKMCRKALSVYGFKVKKIVVIGHHPERFPVFGKSMNNKKNFMYKILMAISKLFKLGDTFEVYAVKK